jgi:thymidylate kinase
MTGKFIAIYGVNNIGKSTQTNLLMQRLLSAGVRAEYVKFPIYDLDPTGKMLNEILRGKKQNSVQTLIDFFPGTRIKKPTSRRNTSEAVAKFRLQAIATPKELKQKVSEEELQMWYSLNRYQYDPIVRRKLASGISIVAEDYIGTGLAWGSAKGADLAWLESVNKYLTKPDLELLMDGERFLAGKEKVHLHESNDRLITKAQAAFQKLGKKNKWQIVNANRSIHEVSEDIWAAIAPLFPRRRSDDHWITPPRARPAL